jgi:hypothetical protein
MANWAPSGSSVSGSGTIDTTGSYLDAVVQQLFVPRSQTNSSATTTGVFTFDQGTVVADNVFIGHQPGTVTSALTFNANGTLNVNGTATLTVSNDVSLGRKIGGSTPVATLNLSSNGTVNVMGNITTNGGTSTINFNGGTSTCSQR